MVVWVQAAGTQLLLGKRRETHAKHTCLRVCLHVRGKNMDEIYRHGGGKITKIKTQE